MFGHYRLVGHEGLSPSQWHSIVQGGVKQGLHVAQRKMHCPEL